MAVAFKISRRFGARWRTRHSLSDEKEYSGFTGAVTLDVDLGISLAASGGQYGTIKSDLEGLGFVSEKQRLVRRKGDIALYIDFLTEDPNQRALGSRVVDEVIASVVPGINRALSLLPDGYCGGQRCLRCRAGVQSESC